MVLVIVFLFLIFIIFTQYFAKNDFKWLLCFFRSHVSKWNKNESTIENALLLKITLFQKRISMKIIFINTMKHTSPKFMANGNIFKKHIFDTQCVFLSLAYIV